MAVLEALASGTPVVTADRGGARELVDDASGAWGVPESAALADAVLEVAARPVAARRAAARARAERYPWSATVTSMLEVHAGLAMRWSRSRAPGVRSSSSVAAAAASMEPTTIAT